MGNHEAVSLLSGSVLTCSSTETPRSSWPLLWIWFRNVMCADEWYSITLVGWSHVSLLLAFSVVISGRRCNQSCQSFSVISGLSPKAARPEALRNVCVYKSTLWSVPLKHISSQSRLHRVLHPLSTAGAINSSGYNELNCNWKDQIECWVSDHNIFICFAYVTSGFIVTMETRQMSLTAKRCYFSLNFLLLLFCWWVCSTDEFMTWAQCWSKWKGNIKEQFTF